MTAAVVSCEHATATVPRPFADALRIPKRVLASHRGSDIGALPLARQLARCVDAPCFAAGASRLLVDANRSLHHPRLFSEWSRALGAGPRADAVSRWWQPHRDAVTRAIGERIAAGERVLHLSVHSFTPVFEGVERDIDVALLYDPSRPMERRFASLWLDRIAALRPDLRLRRNAPYRGVSDGFTTSLRRRFPARRYAGVELEVSQSFPTGPAAPWRALRKTLAETLAAALAEP